MAEEDIIFGKNRHFFGGIEPSNMRVFQANWTGSAVEIKAELPEDTIIDGQTLCTVAGAVIRRKTNGYPKDEFDGILVKTIYESGNFMDIEANDSENIYYYAAFPFSTQGVYTRSEENYAVVNGVVSILDTPTHSIEAGKDDDGLYILLATYRTMFAGDFDGYIICRGENGYPKNENEGVIVDTVVGMPMLISYEDRNVVSGQTYYYSLFLYRINSAGDKVYDYNIDNRLSATARPYGYIYGYDIDLTDPNPNTRVSYPEDVDNATFTPAKMDYSGGTFDYGDWPKVSSIPTDYELFKDRKSFMPVPCVLDADGTVESYLYPDDYTDTDITDTSGTFNAMMKWPKIYTKRWLKDGVYHFRCSDYQHDDDWKCWCNYDKDGNETKYFYTAIYPACETSGPKLRSLSGQQMETGTYAQYQMDYADNNGDGWNIETIADRLLIQDLLVLMAKTTDCQKAYGKGICGGKSAVTETGTMDKRGLFWGSEDPAEGVKVFGMEHWWGNKHRRVAGLVSVDGRYKLKITRSTKDGSTATDFNYDGANYKELTYGFDCEVSQSSEYISDMRVTEYGRLPVKGKGTSTRCEGDAVIINKYGTMFANFGGGASSNEGYAGPFALTLTESKGTSTSTDICVAISYKG